MNRSGQRHFRSAQAVLAAADHTPAQEPCGADYSKVEIKANKITDNFYTLDGDGGTMGVLVGPDGALSRRYLRCVRVELDG